MDPAWRDVVRPALLMWPCCLLLLVACRSVALPAGPAVQPGSIDRYSFRTADGSSLALHRWEPEQQPRAVVLALHGFNDHGGSFAAISEDLTTAGVLLYAYDQRGFGATPQIGRWAGKQALAADARLAAGLLRRRHPDLPLFLLGKSMGGAVAILALAQEDGSADQEADVAEPLVDGLALLAPAVLGMAVMPGHHRLALWLAERLAPGLPLSVELGQALGYRPSDQPEVMAALRDDPLVLDHPRVEAVAGLAELMDAAAQAGPALNLPVLLLYGTRDDLVPKQAICVLLGGVEAGSGPEHWQVRIYDGGYHMLTRYSGAAATREDLLAWLDPAATVANGLTPSAARRNLGCR